MTIKIRDRYSGGSVLWSERRTAPRKGYKAWWTSVSIARVHSGTVGPSLSISG